MTVQQDALDKLRDSMQQLESKITEAKVGGRRSVPDQAPPRTHESRAPTNAVETPKKAQRSKKHQQRRTYIVREEHEFSASAARTRRKVYLRSHDEV